MRVIHIGIQAVYRWRVRCERLLCVPRRPRVSVGGPRTFVYTGRDLNVREVWNILHIRQEVDGILSEVGNCDSSQFK